MVTREREQLVDVEEVDEVRRPAQPLPPDPDLSPRNYLPAATGHTPPADQLATIASRLSFTNVLLTAIAIPAWLGLFAIACLVVLQMLGCGATIIAR